MACKPFHKFLRLQNNILGIPPWYKYLETVLGVTTACPDYWPYLIKQRGHGGHKSAWQRAVPWYPCMYLHTQKCNTRTYVSRTFATSGIFDVTVENRGYTDSQHVTFHYLFYQLLTKTAPRHIHCSVPLSVPALMGPIYTEVKKRHISWRPIHNYEQYYYIWFNYRCMHVMTYRLPFLGKNNTRNAHVHQNTGRFIMFSVITNIYNKKTKGPTLMEFFTGTGKPRKFFWQLEMFYVCRVTRGAHIEHL